MVVTVVAGQTGDLPARDALLVQLALLVELALLTLSVLPGELAPAGQLAAGELDRSRFSFGGV